MSLKDSIADIAKRLTTVKSRTDLGEEATKTAVVMPFLNALGYDIFNPGEVQPEFTADVGTKKGEKVDFAILLDGRVEMIIEVKPVSCALKDAQYSQLYRYFGVTDARIALLTNGADYWFFTDVDAANRMDEKPFFKFSLEAYDDADLRELEKFTREAFSIDQVRSTAAGLKYTRLAANYLNEQIADPDEEFVKFVARNIYDGRLTATAMERMTPCVKRAFDDVIRQRVRARLQTALSEDEESEEEAVEEAPVPADDGIVTTEEELQAFYIVRAIAAEIVDPARIAIRDQKSYCGVLFDDNNRKPIVRLGFDGRQKWVALFDENKEETRVNVDGPEDLYRYRGEIKGVISNYVER